VLFSPFYSIYLRLERNSLFIVLPISIELKESS
jgi:hypothetical protein